MVRVKMAEICLSMKNIRLKMKARGHVHVGNVTALVVVVIRLQVAQLLL